MFRVERDRLGVFDVVRAHAMPVAVVALGVADLLTDASPPKTLHDAVPTAPDRPVLLIADGALPDEIDTASHLRDRRPRRHRHLGGTKHRARPGPVHPFTGLGAAGHDLPRPSPDQLTDRDRPGGRRWVGWVNSPDGARIGRNSHAVTEAACWCAYRPATRRASGGVRP